jgi:RimJ/RimL family protein N-acetyltransferase
MPLTARFPDIPSLETPRLRLRKLILADAADTFAYASDPEVARYVRFVVHKSIADSEQFISRIIQQYVTGAEPVWGVELKATATIVGSIGFVKWDRDNRRIELGYALGRPWWGQGIAPEAVATIVEFTFAQTNVNRIEAFCFAEHSASARVLEKCGFQFEGVLRQYEEIKGCRPDLKVYSKLRCDWEAGRRSPN